MLKYTVGSRQGTKNLEIKIKLPNGEIKRISSGTSNRKQAEIKAKTIVADYENQINNAIPNVNSKPTVQMKQFFTVFITFATSQI